MDWVHVLKGSEGEELTKLCGTDTFGWAGLKDRCEWIRGEYWCIILVDQLFLILHVINMNLVLIVLVAINTRNCILVVLESFDIAVFVLPLLVFVVR